MSLDIQTAKNKTASALGSSAEKFKPNTVVSIFKDGKILLVKKDEKVIGGIMCPILNNQTIYEWFVCGLDVNYHEQYPSVLATYSAMAYAHKNGISRFDFMGAGTPDTAYGVRDFKARFGGELVEHGRYRFVSRQFLYKCGELGVTLLKRQ